MPYVQDIAPITVSETDTVVIQAEVMDPDDDELSFKVDSKDFVQVGNVFTWETTYDDAGEYMVTVTVSDGVDEVSKEVGVKVENINRPPTIIDIIKK